MELALVSLGDHVPDPHADTRITQSQKFRLVVEHAVRETAGFASVMLGEHHFTDYILSVPQILLAAIAERTTTVRLNTGVTLLPTQDPVRLAEDCGALRVHRSHRQRGHPAARAGTGRCRGPMMEAPNTAETACNTHTHTPHTPHTINTDTKRTG